MGSSLTIASANPGVYTVAVPREGVDRYVRVRLAFGTGGGSFGDYDTGVPNLVSMRSDRGATR